MRKAWNIIWRVLVALLLLVYLTVAAVNYSVVQSYIGAAAGRHFSREWGATVRIGSIEVTPWDHLSHTTYYSSHPTTTPSSTQQR